MSGDEGKPNCRNCSARNVTCRYGDWTFVFDGPRRPVADTVADGGASQVDTDVDSDSHVITAASPLVTIPQVPVDIVNYHRTSDGDSSRIDVRGPSTPQSMPSAIATVTAGEQSVTNSDSMPVWISHDLTDDVTCTELTPRQPTDEHSWQQGSMNRQSALLRFRYQVVPWIESNNCKSIFGPAIMTLARDSRIISDCISASVQTKSDNLDVGSTTSVGLSMSPRLLDRLACEDTLTADIGFALLTISSVFYTPPSEWAVIVSTCETRLAESVILGGGFELTPEPLKSLLRLHLKVGKLRRISESQDTIRPY
jgi:hypothetical protein